MQQSGKISNPFSLISVADETHGEELVALVTIALVSLSGFLQLSWINCYQIIKISKI